MPKNKDGRNEIGRLKRKLTDTKKTPYQPTETPSLTNRKGRGGTPETVTPYDPNKQSKKDK